MALAACLPLLLSTPLRAAADHLASELAPPAAEEKLWCDAADSGSASAADAPTGGVERKKREWKTGKLFVQDAGAVFSAPARWETKQWREFTLATAGVVGIAFFDPAIRNAVQDHRGATVDKFADFIEPFGLEYSYAVIAGFYIGGLSAHDRNARETAVDSIAATLIASGIITPVLKEVAGRARPYQSEGAYHFKPFSGDDSFPSGHATQAFAVASVIASHYDRRWVKGLVYGIAGSVGIARMVHERHWASDVVAGALIGASVGTEVVRFNRKARVAGTRRYSVVPLIDPRGYGGVFVAMF